MICNRSSGSINQSIDRKKTETAWASFRPATIFSGLLLGVALLLSTAEASAQEQLAPKEETGWDANSKRRILLLRPHVGVGWARGDKDSGNGLALHAGGRVLFPAPLSDKVSATFGLEATYVDLDVRESNALPERYAAVGIVLELTLFENFNLGIGTLGYIGLGSTDRNPFGLVTNLGWEPTWSSRVLPFISLRTEWIFDQEVFNVLSLSVGINFGIGK